MSRFLEKRSMRLAGHRTSVALEPEFWREIERLAEARKYSITQFVSVVDRERSMPRQSLASALRCQVLRLVKMEASA